MVELLFVLHERGLVVVFVDGLVVVIGLRSLKSLRRVITAHWDVQNCGARLATEMVHRDVEPHFVQAARVFDVLVLDVFHLVATLRKVERILLLQGNQIDGGAALLEFLLRLVEGVNLHVQFNTLIHNELLALIVERSQNHSIRLLFLLLLFPLVMFRDAIQEVAFVPLRF